jgi:hypothetical protein
MVDLKSSVKTATAFAKEMFPEAMDIRLEEVEPKPNGGWTVVVSFRTLEPGTLAVVMGNTEASRIFKTIAIDPLTGEPQSLKVWKQ